MKPISPLGLPIGLSITIWTIIGIARFISENIHFKKKRLRKRSEAKVSDIAAIVPAHNEEVVIRKCIQALKVSLKPGQIYIVSDGSSDKTYRRARAEGCHVSQLKPGMGKAKAMIYLIRRYSLFKRYKFIFIVDADTNIDKKLVGNALELLKDPTTSVVFGSSQIEWPVHLRPRLKYYFWAYRDRLNRMLQYLFIYGQTWKYTNVNYVIPGFCTIYRSKILKKLEIDTPGLQIEDFNLAFQFHKKKLGKLAFGHNLIGWDQYPDNLVDYWKQLRRWNIGFFQTVKKNGVWPSMFWLTLGLFSFEVILHSLFVLFLPLTVFFLLAPYMPIDSNIIKTLSNLYPKIGLFENINFKSLFINIIILDYLFTVAIAILKRRPQFLFYGLFFIVMHYITSLVLISSIFPGVFGKSSGRWTSPKRFTI